MNEVTLIYCLVFLAVLALVLGAICFFRGVKTNQEIDRMLSESFHRGYQAAMDEGWDDLFAQRERLSELERENAQLLIQIGSAQTRVLP